MHKLLESVASATRLREGPAGVEAILRRVHGAERLTLADLSAETSLPKPVLSAVRRELERAGLLTRHQGGLTLTPDGRRFVEETLGVTASAPPTTTAPTDAAEGPVSTVTDAMTRAFAGAPRVDTTLDQCFATPETTARRAWLMHQADALAGRSVLLLGDDDLLSLAIGYLGRALGAPRLCTRLVVMDTDRRILDHIEAVATREGFEVETVLHDLRAPLPDALLGRFDVFETDPPYTVDGLSLFLTRARAALRPGAGCQGFLSFGHRDPDETLEVQRRTTGLGFVIAERIPRFNAYVGAQILGGHSHLTRLLTASATPDVPNEPWGGAIYSGERAPSLRLYACLACRRPVRVGQGGDFTTIEDLKAAGCPGCCADRFRYLRREDDAAARPPAPPAQRPAAPPAQRPAAPTSARAIRPARAEDLDAVVPLEIEIARISFPEDPVTDPSSHHKRLGHAFRKDPVGMFVLDAGGEVQGWLWVSINQDFTTGAAYGNFRSLAVVPALRGTDAPLRLVEHAIAFCRQRGAVRITGKVHVSNVAMRAVYAQAGFLGKHLTMELRLDGGP